VNGHSGRRRLDQPLERRTRGALDVNVRRPAGSTHVQRGAPGGVPPGAVVQGATRAPGSVEMYGLPGGALIPNDIKSIDRNAATHRLAVNGKGKVKIFVHLIDGLIHSPREMLIHLGDTAT
jgi:hypothetical protein